MPQNLNRLIKPIKIYQKDVIANKQLQSSKPGVRNLLSVMQLSLAQHSVNPISKIRYRHPNNWIKYIITAHKQG